MTIPLGLYGAAQPGGVSLADAIMALAPAGYWKLDESSGTTAVDSSGNARHGTYSGTYTLAGTGGHLSVSGGGYVNLGDLDAWSLAPNGVTVFALACPASTSGMRAVVTKGDGSAYEWATIVNAGKPGTYIWDQGGGTDRGEVSTLTIPTGAWSALTYRIPGANPATVRPVMYVNTETPITSTATGLNPTIGNYGASLNIGRRADNGQYWSGAFAHVAVFTGLLTSAQVGTLMAAAAAEGWI